MIERGVAAGLILFAAATAPPWVAEAVRAGSTPAKLEAYSVPGLAITYTTPFLRVARAANAAVRAGRPFGVADVEAKAYAPELRLLVGVRAVTEGGRLLATAGPKSIRLLVGAGEIKASRIDAGTMKQTVTIEGGAPDEVTAGVLKAVFPIAGSPPRGAFLEITYTAMRDGRAETIVERAALDFQKTRW